jgi:hypothetical protein
MAMNKNGAATRFRAMRDELRDPLLTLLTILLIIVVFVIIPLHAAGTISAEGHGFVIILLLSSGVLTQSTRWMVLFALLLGIALEAAEGIARSRSGYPLDLYLDAIALVIIGATLIYVVAGAVFAPGRVTYHSVNGAVLLYLTIGMTFVGLYSLVALRSPHAFSGLTISDSRGLPSSVIYFSFVTLTSVGYGDVVPVHPVPRALANLEGIIGQLFPATLLARLVTLELEDRRDRSKGGN